MGVIQSTVNQTLSGTAYLLQMHKIAEEKKAKAEDQKKKTIHDYMSKMGKQGAAARKAKAEQAMKESLQNQNDTKQNSTTVKGRMRKKEVPDNGINTSKP